MSNTNSIKSCNSNDESNNIEIEVKLEIDKEKYNELLNFLINENTKHIHKMQDDIYFSPECPSFLETK